MSALQIRDMPQDAVETLRRRARARGMSLSAYRRELLLREAGRKTMEEVLAGPRLVQGPPLSNEEIRALIEDGRH
jgi:plasmid stability protein